MCAERAAHDPDCYLCAGQHAASLGRRIRNMPEPLFLLMILPHLLPDAPAPRGWRSIVPGQKARGA